MHRIPSILAGLACVLPHLAAQDAGRTLFETYGAGWSRSGGYATSLAVVGDLDGDGIADVAVGDPTYFYSGGGSGSGTVDLLSGRNGTLLQTCNPTGSDFDLGIDVAAVGDANGDGTPDVVAAARNAVLVFSGADGSVLVRFAAAPTRVLGPGDWDGDQVPDIGWLENGSVRLWTVGGASIATIGSGGVSAAQAQPPTGGVPVRDPIGVIESGVVRIYDPAGGSIAVGSGYTNLGPAGDFDGDGTGDLVASHSTTAEVRSGQTGALLAQVAGGAAAASGADLDGDGVLDIAVGDSSAAATGVVRVYSGASGAPLLERFGLEAREGFGWSVALHPGAGSPQRSAVLCGSIARFDGSLETGAVSAVALAAPGEVDGWFRPFGQTCNFSNTRIRPGRGRPQVGRTYGFRFDNNTTPQGFQYLVIGDSRTSFNGTPLPARLPDPRSCARLYVSIDIVEFAGLNSFASVSIPNNPVFLGYTAHLQGFSLLGAPYIETSDAAEMLIGN